MSLRTFTRLPVQRSFVAVRPFSISAARSKTLVDSVKETADAVNKKVGQALASGIDSVEQTTESAKQTINEKTPSVEEVKEKTVEAKQSANQSLADAQVKARDTKDEAKKNL